MNKTYIKRQLTLDDLGIPMNEDIQNYVNLFNEIIGDPKELITEQGQVCFHITYSESVLKDDMELFFYNEQDKRIWIEYDNFWAKFEEQFNLKNTEISVLFIVLFKKYLGYDISDIDWIGVSDIFIRYE